MVEFGIFRAGFRRAVWKSGEVKMSDNLEKCINRRKLSQEDVEEIINSYETYGGNALRASKNLRYAVTTILRYWRSAELRIKPRGEPKNILNYNLVNDLILSNYSQIEMAKKLGISPQAVNEYIKRHRLKKPVSSKKKNMEYKYNLVKRLIEEEDFFEEIAGFIGINNSSFNSYLKRHPDLPKPKKRRIELIRKGLEEGLSRSAIATANKINFARLNRDINNNSELIKLDNLNLLSKLRK